MKKIAAILAVVLCLCALAAPVAALSKNGSYGKVPMYDGKITVDGKMDEIYKKGLKIEVAGDYQGIPSDATAVAYLLHDGKYVYMLMEVDNKYPLGEYLETTTNWKETGFELYFDWKDTGVKADMYKYIIWGNGKNWEDAAIPEKGGIAEIKAVQDAAKKTYAIEVKVAIAGGAKTGSSVGWNVAVASNTDPKKPAQQHIAVPTKVDGKKVCNAPDQWLNITLDSAKVALDTTAATTKAPAAKPASPATFDAGIVMAVVAAVAGAGVVVSKKKH